MRKRTYINHRPAVVFLIGFLLVFMALPLPGQEKLQTSPGGYHGEMDFPMSWKRYYAYEEWTKIMHELQKKYSQLANLQTIGKSRMGREQFLLTITAQSTGKDTDKPAMWVDGAIHGNEVNGISCSLYLAWYLLTRYDYDKSVHELVDNCTFYILPGLNVDANDSYVRFPNTANNPRESYRPEDDDGDGLFDEDQTEDVDGDGELSMMYIEDPEGEFKLSADKRQFLQVSDEREEVKRFRRIGAEGFDNDGDGRINEDDIGGPDLNRNFPYGWSLQQGWPYPLSEPETRNVYTFQLAHSNIYASFHYHNTGRLIMFQAPPQSKSFSPTPEERRQYQEQLAKRLEEMRKSNQYAQLFDRVVDKEYQHDMDVQTEIVGMGARILKNYRPTIGGLSGQAHAATYYLLGAYSYLIELWGTPAFEADENADGRVTEEEMLKWIDVELAGEGWIVPHRVKHPDLGEVWIGGTAKKHITRTPPSRYIEEEALRNAQFVLYCASQFPKVKIEKIRVIPATENLFWLDAVVRNDRVFPTSSDRAVALKRAVKDKILFSSSANISLLDLPEGETVLDPFDSGSRAEAGKGKETEFRLQGKQKLRFRYLVKMDGSSGWVEFQTGSKMGGTDKKRITIKVAD